MPQVLDFKTIRSTFWAAPLGAYVVLLGIRAALSGQSFVHVELLPHEPTAGYVLALDFLALVAGYAAILFVPGVLWARALCIEFRSGVSAALGTHVLSAFVMAVAWFLFQPLAGSMGVRGAVLLSTLFVCFAALGVQSGLSRSRASGPPEERPSTRLTATDWVAVGLTIGAVLVATILMPGKVALEALEGDATEVFGFAASLELGRLPSWDLESGAWGFYPTFMFISYPVFSSMAVLGATESAVRVPALFYMALVMLASFELVVAGCRRVLSGKDAFWIALPIAVCGYMSLQVGAYYSGYHPFHGDLASSPLEEWCVVAFALISAVLVRDGSTKLGVLAGLLSVLTFPSGLMLVGLIFLGGLVLPEREVRQSFRRATVQAIVAGAAYAVLLIAYTQWQGTFDAMIVEWYEKYFQGRGDVTAEDPARMARAFGWFVMLAGGLPVLGFILGGVLGGRTARWMALVGAAWVAFFTLSPNKNIHYFMPAALFPLVAFLRCWIDREAWTRLFPGVSLALTASAVTCIALSWPASVPPYVADREFAERTIFLADSEREAVDYSGVIFNLTRPLWAWRPGAPWTIGRHTWVLYAGRGHELTREYDYYVGGGDPPLPNLKRLARIRTPERRSATMWASPEAPPFREWKKREFPLKRDLNRFNFEMTR